MTSTPTATPPLLETYEEARFLWEAKGWGMEGVGIELAEKPELKRFKISQPTLSRKTKPGSKLPIEPEIAAAVENLETRPGYERQVEIAIRGLLALHGATRGEDVGQLLKEMRERLPGEITLNVIEALEAKAGARDERLVQKVEGLGRFSWKHAFSSGVGAFLGCLVLVPVLLIGLTAISAGTHGRTIPPGGPDTSPRWFEPESMLPEPPLIVAKWGEKRPLDQTVPFRTLPGQKMAPCDAELGQVEINGNCWAALRDVKPLAGGSSGTGRQLCPHLREAVASGAQPGPLTGRGAPPALSARASRPARPEPRSPQGTRAQRAAGAVPVPVPGASAGQRPPER